MWHKIVWSALAVGILASPMALAESSSDNNLSMDQVLAQTDQSGATASNAQGIKPRRNRLQLSGDSGAAASNGFNPAISVILDGVYGNFNREVEDPAGFGGGHGHGHGSEEGGGHGIEEGFDIREAEIGFSGSVDAFFDMEVYASVTESSIELEEAYFVTNSLPSGLQVKAGKFLSDVGYINRQHLHDWDFVDSTWMQDLIFGGEGLNEKGIQFSWVAPTANYTRFGVEVLEGETEGVASFIGAEEENGLGDESSPRLFTAFMNYAPNLGFNHNLQFGLSYGFASAFQEEEEEESGALATTEGDAWFAGTDVVYKYDGEGAMGQGDLTLQAEYFIRERDLTFRELEGGAVEESGKIRPRQDAAYIQSTYGFAPRWDVGARLDAVGMTNKAFAELDPEDASTSFRYSTQVSFLPTEFSRIRAQVQYNDLDKPEGSDIEDAWQFFLQINMALGAHGAHGF